MQIQIDLQTNTLQKNILWLWFDFHIWDSSSWDKMRRDQYLEYKRGLNMNIPAPLYFMMYNILNISGVQ